MACEKHGYTNPTFCPACDQETIEKYAEPPMTTPAPAPSGDIVERLRAAHKWAVAENDHFEPELGAEAADVIEGLRAEREQAQRVYIETLQMATDELHKLRTALEDIRSRARFEQDHPTELRDTAFSLIEKVAKTALATLGSELRADDSTVSVPDAVGAPERSSK